MKFAALLIGLLGLSIVQGASAEVATPNDTARFLAGLPPDPSSPLAALAEHPGWRRYADDMNSMFRHVDEIHLSKIRAFSKARMNPTHDTMLYMFSGPDALHAVAFFPHASTYVLSGLEPAGNIPELISLPRGAVHWTLRRLVSALDSMLTLSFFRTKDMKSQLRSGPVYGTLPVIYIFLARSGKTIHEMSFVTLDEAGNVITLGQPGGEISANGVKIVFSVDQGPNQTLYYFSTNLANDGVRNSGFLTFCGKLGGADSLLKSASYLLHDGNFSTVRRFLLDHSATIVQDDSGIPLNYFDREKWRLQPFGRYVAPILTFARNYQSQMAELFRRGHPIPIDFGVGYRWRLNESNLLLAEKIPERDAD